LTFAHWLQWLTAFLIVVAILAVAAGVSEWWKWHKEKRR
jgi:uncharacterized membrane protein YidH (DUF202 family)